MSLLKHRSKNVDNDLDAKREDEFRKRANTRFGLVDIDEQAQISYNSNLMIVGAHLTQICHPNGGTADDIVDTYTHVMSKLVDWLNIVPLREKLESMLDDAVFSEYSYKEQPVMPTYTPLLKRKHVITDHKQA